MKAKVFQAPMNTVHVLYCHVVTVIQYKLYREGPDMSVTLSTKGAKYECNA